MPKREIKHPEKEKSTGAYSAAVEIDGWVYVSGQGPVDPKTAQPIRGSIEEETLYTLTQIKKILEAAGADIVLLECIPSSLGGAITRELEVPVIGIGAGPDTDGQILVLYDVLDITAGRKPRFSKNSAAI